MSARNDGGHTLGPWVYYPESGSACAALIAEGSFVCEFIEAPKIEDARLIAAAPDLLAALKLCAAVCAGETSHKGGLIAALESARAAITKAEA